MSDLKAIMDQLLPDESVVFALRSVLEGDQEPIELEGRNLHVSADVRLEVIKRCAIQNGDEIGFGDHLCAVVAVGGVKAVAHGVVEPEGCFATLYFAPGGSLITVDFSSKMP